MLLFEQFVPNKWSQNIFAYSGPMIFNFSGAVAPNETVQRLEELLCIYLNLIYLNPALNCKLVESLDSTGGTSLENLCSRFMFLIA